MIELDIKIRAKDNENLKVLIGMMKSGLSIENNVGPIDVTFSAEKNGDTITVIRKEIITK